MPIFMQDDVETDVEDADMEVDEEILGQDVEEKPSNNVVTNAMVDLWCNSIKENGQLSAVRHLMRAFRTACHYGDDAADGTTAKFTTMSSSVFNKIMLFSLMEMDGILRNLLKLPSSGGKKETIIELMHTKQWKRHNHLVKSYLGNSLHVLNQMTDSEMISFSLRRLKFSSVFLAAFPSLLRKYIKVCDLSKSLSVPSVISLCFCMLYNMQIMQDLFVLVLWTHYSDMTLHRLVFRKEGLRNYMISQQYSQFTPQ